MCKSTPVLYTYHFTKGNKMSTPNTLDEGDILRESYFESRNEDECRGLTGWQHRYFMVTEINKKVATIMTIDNRVAKTFSKINAEYPFKELCFTNHTVQYISHISDFHKTIEDSTTYKIRT